MAVPFLGIPIQGIWDLYQQDEQPVVDEAPCLPLWFGASYILAKPHVRDYELSPLGVADLSQVYLEQS